MPSKEMALRGGRAPWYFCRCASRATFRVLGLSRQATAWGKFAGLLWRGLLLLIPAAPGVAKQAGNQLAAYLPSSSVLVGIIVAAAAVAWLIAFLQELWGDIRSLARERDALQARLGEGLVFRSPVATIVQPAHDELDYPESSRLTFTGWSVRFPGMVAINQSSVVARLSFSVQVRINGTQQSCPLQPQGAGEESSLGLPPRGTREFTLASKVEHRAAPDSAPSLTVDWIEVEDFANPASTVVRVAVPPIRASPPGVAAEPPSRLKRTSTLSEKQLSWADSTAYCIPAVILRHAGLALPANALFVDLHAVVIEKRLPEKSQSRTTYDLTQLLRCTNGISDPVQLRDLFQEAMRRGNRRCVLVRGDIGSGKSTLLKVFARAALGHDEARVPSSKPLIIAWMDARSIPNLVDVPSVLAALPSCGVAAANSYRVGQSSVLVILDDLHLDANPDVILAGLARLSKSDDVFVLVSCNQYDSSGLAQVPPEVLDVALCHPTRAQAISIIEATTRAGAQALLGNDEKATERAAIWTHEVVRQLDQIVFDASVLADDTCWKGQAPDLTNATPAYWAELTDMVMHNCRALRIPYWRAAGSGHPEDCSAFSNVELSKEFFLGRLLSELGDTADVAGILEGACIWAARSLVDALYKMSEQSVYDGVEVLALDAWRSTSEKHGARVIALLARLDCLDRESRYDGDGLPRPAGRSASCPMVWHLAGMWLVRHLDENTFAEFKRQLIEDSLVEIERGDARYNVWSLGKPKPALALLIAMCGASGLDGRLDRAFDMIRVLNGRCPSFGCMLIANCPRVTMELVEEALVRAHWPSLSTAYSGPDYEIRGRIVDCCLDWFGRGNLTAEFLVRLGQLTKCVSDLYFLDGALDAIGSALYGKDSRESRKLRHRLYETLGSPGSWIAWRDEAAGIPRWVWLPRTWTSIDGKWDPSPEGVWTFCTPVTTNEIEDLCRRKGDLRGFRATTWYDAVVFCRWVGIHARGTLEGRLPTCDEIEGMYEAWWKSHQHCPIRTAGLDAAMELQARNPESDRGLVDRWGARGEEMSCDTADRTELAGMGETAVAAWSLGPFWCGVGAEQDKGLVFHRSKFVANAWYNLTGENAVFRPVLPMDLPAWEGYEKIFDKTHDRGLWVIPRQTSAPRGGFLESILEMWRSRDP